MTLKLQASNFSRLIGGNQIYQLTAGSSLIHYESNIKTTQEE